MLRFARILLTIPFASGCFTYAPIDFSDVTPAMSIRVRVTEDGQQRLPSGSDRSAPIEGQVIEVDGTRLSVLPEFGSAVTDPVSLPQADIQLLERRELSQQKTLLVAGAGIALGAAVLLRIRGEPGANGGSGNPPDFTRVPLVQVRVP